MPDIDSPHFQGVPSMSLRRCSAFAVLALVFISLEHSPTIRVSAQERQPATNVSQWRDLRWRNIGPHRGGRGKSAVGIPDQPNVFYIGFHNGGVWKTTD